MQCQFQFPLGKLYFLIWSSCRVYTPNGKWALISQQTRKHRVEYPVHWGQQKIPVRVGVSVLPFLAVTLLNEVYMSWKQQNGPRVLETSLKNKEDGGRVAEEFVLAQFPRRVLEFFFALSTPHGFRSNSKEKNKQTNNQKSCYRIPWFKRLWWFQRQTRDLHLHATLILTSTPLCK